MVQKGATGVGSQLGHYNFYYPDNDIKITFLRDVVVKTMNWAKQGDLVAISVQSSALSISTNISSKTYIVWVNSSVIKSY